MKTVFLHIGLHKTGSTAIQSAFSRLELPDIIYARLGHENHSIALYTAFSETYQTYHIWKRRNETPAAITASRKAYRAQLAQVMQANRHRDVILSGEDISALSVPALTALKEALSVTHGRIQVLAYLRDPVSFMRSALQENIKNGTNPRAPAPPSYRGCIERVRTVFGHDNVLLRAYDRASLRDGDVIADFAAALGLDSVPRPRHSNVSLSTEAVRVLYRLNRQSEQAGPGTHPHWSRTPLIGHLRQLLPGPFELPDPLIAGRVRHADLDWLFQMTGIDFRTPCKPPAQAFDPEALAQYLTAIAPGTFDTLRAASRRKEPGTALPEDPEALLRQCATVLGRPSRGTRIREAIARLGVSRAGLSRMALSTRPARWGQRRE